MAAVATPAADQTAGLMKNLKLDSQTKARHPAEVTNKYDSGNGGEAQNGSVPPRENVCYMPSGYPSTAYYYGGYGGSANDWGEFHGYMNHEGGEMPSGVYGDVYHQGYGYATYGAYPSPDSPVPTMGNEGQLYGARHYQYPQQYYQPPTPAASYTPNQVPPSQGGVSTSAAADQPPVLVNSVKATPNGTAKVTTNRSNRIAPLKPSHQNESLTSNNAYVKGGVPGGLPSSGYQDFRYGYDAIQSHVSWYDGTSFPAGQHIPATTTPTFPHNSSNYSARNQNLRRPPHPMDLHTQRQTSGMSSLSPGFQNKLYPNNQMYGQYGNTFRTGSGFGPNTYDSRINGRSLATDNKYKPRGRGNDSYGYGNENLDGFSELNRGPRADCFKNQKAVGPNVTIAVKGQNLSSIAKEDVGVIPDREQYNREDFPEKYSDAKFFIIKSYSEDDIHRSIKYGVWASTPNGNKKLDGAYREAQEKAGDCPVFLLFSVNTSGQFVGLAEMVGPVDFQKTLDYWQQDKWFGCFSVKWHIVKDVPNSMLKHIILENNDNKPVTNSRDTQEVKLDQGLQMIKLFKEYVSKTSIFHDFGFYETRQKMMQEKRAKQPKQVSDDKTSEALVAEKVVDTGVKAILQKMDSVSVSNNEAGQGVPGEQKPSHEISAGMLAGDSSEVAESTTEKPAAGNVAASENPAAVNGGVGVC